MTSLNKKRWRPPPPKKPPPPKQKKIRLRGELRCQNCFRTVEGLAFVTAEAGHTAVVFALCKKCDPDLMLNKIVETKRNRQLKFQHVINLLLKYRKVEKVRRRDDVVKFNPQSLLERSLDVLGQNFLRYRVDRLVELYPYLQRALLESMSKCQSLAVTMHRPVLEFLAGEAAAVVASDCFRSSYDVAIMKHFLQEDCAQTLQVSFNRIRPKDLFPFTALIQNTTCLSSLDLSYNKIDPEGAAMIGAATVSNSTLTSLSLSGNPLRIDGATHISEMIGYNTKLKTLQLRHCEFDGVAAGVLCKGLSRNSTLTSIDLRGNDIAEEGVWEITNVIRTWQFCALKTLRLTDNDIGEDGACEIAKYVRLPLRELVRVVGCEIDKCTPQAVAELESAVSNE